MSLGICKMYELNLCSCFTGVRLETQRPPIQRSLGHGSYGRPRNDEYLVYCVYYV